MKNQYKKLQKNLLKNGKFTGDTFSDKYKYKIPFRITNNFSILIKKAYLLYQNFGLLIFSHSNYQQATHNFRFTNTKSLL